MIEKDIRQLWVNALSIAVHKYNIEMFRNSANDQSVMVGYYLPETIRDALGRVGVGRLRWQVRSRSRFVIEFGLWGALYDLAMGRYIKPGNIGIEFAAYRNDGIRFGLRTKGADIGDGYTAHIVYLSAGPIVGASA